MLSHWSAPSTAAATPWADTTFLTAVLQPSRVGFTTQGNPISASTAAAVAFASASHFFFSMEIVLGTSMPEAESSLRHMSLSMPRAEARTPDPV